MSALIPAASYSKPLAAGRVRGGWIALILALFFSSALHAQSTQPTYSNPVATGIADPFVIRVNNDYFCYATGSSRGFRVRQSKDLVHWSDPKFCFLKSASTWGQSKFWAPCVVQKGNQFFFFYSAEGPVAGGHNSLRICEAVASSPAGPFTDVAAPFLDIGHAVIDAQVNIFADGRAFLYYSLDISENGKSEICVVPLSEDLRRVTGPPIKLTSPTGGWEGNQWNEGPFVLQFGRQYVLIYSANYFASPSYSLGYAVANSPTGPFTKSKDNPILEKTAEVSGPGHNCVIASPNGSELFCVYHTQQKLIGGGARDLSIDRMTVTESPDGTVHLHIDGPTKSPQPMPR